MVYPAIGEPTSDTKQARLATDSLYAVANRRTSRHRMVVTLMPLICHHMRSKLRLRTIPHTKLRRSSMKSLGRATSSSLTVRLIEIRTQGL